MWFIVHHPTIVKYSSLILIVITNSLFIFDADTSVVRTIEPAATNPTTATSTTAITNSTDINDTSATQFSTERLSEFYAFAQAGNVYDRLVKSFAPSIWEMDDVKRGLLCLLIGGTIRKGRGLLALITFLSVP